MIFKNANITSVPSDLISTFAKAIFPVGKNIATRLINAKSYIDRILESPGGVEFVKFFGINEDVILNISEKNNIDLKQESDVRDYFNSLGGLSIEQKLLEIKKVAEVISTTDNIDALAKNYYSGLQKSIDLKLEKYKPVIITEVTEEIPAEVTTTLSSDPGMIAENYAKKELEKIEPATLDDFWYVSPSERPPFFSKEITFYGPFENKYVAVLFSTLIHRPNFLEDRAVANRTKLLDFKIDPKSAIPYPYSTSLIKNTNYLSSIEQLSNDLRLNLDPNEGLFKAILDSIKSIPSKEISHFTLAKWFDNLGFRKLLEDYEGGRFVKEQLKDEQDQINGVIPSNEERLKSEPFPKKQDEPQKRKYRSMGRVTKKEENTPDLIEVSPIIITSFSPAQLNTVSVVSEDGMLVDAQIMKYIEELKINSRGLSGISLDVIKNSYSSTTNQINDFFKGIASKDAEIRALVFEYRKNNPLGGGGITSDWEFKTLYSIFSRISKDPEIINNISNLISNVALVKYLYKDDAAVNRIRDRINLRISLKSTEKGQKNDPDSFLPQVKELVEKAVLESAFSLTIRKIETVCNETFTSVNTEKLLDEVISEVRLQSIIEQSVSKVLADEAAVISEMKIATYKCTICSQKFFIPKEYEEALSSSDGEIDSKKSRVPTYSFFRPDGSLITEEELISSGPYSISDEIRKILSKEDRDVLRSTVVRRTDKTVPAGRSTRARYSWQEINEMIYSQNASDQIDGLIIRNDILRLKGGALIPASSLFSNKVACASERITRLTTSYESSSKATRDFIEKNQHFRCEAYARPITTDIPSEVRSYQQSAYKTPFGNALKISGAIDYSNSGFRFSKLFAHCPCHITQNNDVISQYGLTNDKSNHYNFIAVPKISPAGAIALEKSLGLQANEIYSPPTDPSGGHTLSQGSGYVICGKKVSISMFDRDASSPNYIGKLFQDTLKTENQSDLLDGRIPNLKRIIDAMISFGIDINDIKPHVEFALQTIGQSLETVSKTSKKRIIEGLFKESKLSLAQSGLTHSLIGGLGLVCEYGHRFTINQSWEFARSHAAMPIDIRMGTKSLRESAAIINNPDSVIQRIMEIGLYKSEITENDLRLSGYRSVEDFIPKADEYNEAKITEIRSILKSLMFDNKIYTKQDDGSIYIIGSPKREYYTTKRQKLGSRKTAWDIGTLDSPKKTDLTILGYAAGHLSSSKVSEEGEYIQLSEEGADILERIEEHESLLSEADDKTGVSPDDYLSKNLELFEIIPQLDIDKIIAKNQSPAYAELEQFNQLKKKSTTFIKMIISTIGMARTCVKLAADAQMDIFSKSKVQLNTHIPKTKTSIRDGIISILDVISEEAGVNKDLFTSEFFKRYDLSGILSESFYKEFFFTFGSISRYYDGVNIPPLEANNPAKIKGDLLNEISQSLLKNIPMILNDLRFDNTRSLSINAILENKINSLSNLLVMPFLPIFESVTAIRSLTENVITDYTGRVIVISHATNSVEKMVKLFNSYFFNQNSNLYVGDYGSEGSSALQILTDILSYKSIDNVLVPSFFLMKDDEFLSVTSALESALLSLYGGKQIFESYMNFKGIKIKSDKLDDLKLQMAVVFYRYNRIFEEAEESLKSISIDAPNRVLDESRLSKSSQILDASIMSLAVTRSGVEDSNIDDETREARRKQLDRMHDEISAKRAALGENVFQQNPVGYAKLILDASNVCLSDIAPTNLTVSKYFLNKDYILDSYFDSIKSELGDVISSDYIEKIKDNFYIYRLNELYVGQSLQYFFGIVPKTPELLKGKPIGNLDLIDYLKFDSINIIRVNTPQLINFAKNFLKSKSVDYNRLVLVQKSILGSRASVKIKEEDISSVIGEINDFSLRISQIDSQPMIWPPSNNLFFSEEEYCRRMEGGKYLPLSKDKKNHQDLSLVGSINSKLDQIISKDDFEKNLENFQLSATSRNYSGISSHGLLIPISPGGLDPNKISTASNYISRESRKERSDVFHISSSSLKIRDQDQVLLDISWAFKMLDPQIEVGEGGEKIIKNKLVQSGVVQKLDYISERMKEIYAWFYSNTPQAINAIITSDLNTPSSYQKNYDQFLNQFFSISNPLIRIKNDLELEVKYADIVQLSGNAYAEYVTINHPDLSRQFFNKIKDLINYYNYSQRLNKIYKTLNPSIGFSSAFDAVNKSKTLAPTIYLLDPYSLWRMVNNPTMSTTFGGPIDSEKINSYKNFIITTFCIGDLAYEIFTSCGFELHEFKTEDIFDIKSFIEKYKDPQSKKINSLKKLLGIVIEDGIVKTYTNGYPINIGESKALSNILNKISQDSAYYGASIEDSYIKYPYRLGNIFDSKNTDESRQRDLDLQNGRAAHTSEELLAISRQAKFHDYKNLASELQRIFSRLYTLSPEKKSSYKTQSISKRASTIYESLYMEWWDAYQNMMAKINRS